VLAFAVCALAQDQPPQPAQPAAPETPEPVAPAAPEPEAPAAEAAVPGPQPAGALVLVTPREKVSYGIGLDIGRNFVRQSIDIDADILARGIKDAMSNATPLVTQQELQEALTAFQAEVQARQQELAKTVGDKNAKEGAEFLAKNKEREGVVTLPSGLQYEVIAEGAGEMPKATDTVSVNYRGTLVDGTEFDSSARHGGPATFPVNKVIPGWTEALQLMKVGSKWRLFVPANLAYGALAGGGPIGPNATLIFDIELLSITPAAPPK